MPNAIKSNGDDYANRTDLHRTLNFPHPFPEESSVYVDSVHALRQVQENIRQPAAHRINSLQLVQSLSKD